MTSGQYRTALAVLAVAGLLGGMLGSWALPRPDAWAQGGAAAEPGAEAIRAQRFVLVGEAGRTRAVLATLEDGGPRLGLYDTAGEARAVLGVLPDDSPYLSFGDAVGQPRVDLVVAEGGASILMLGDADGQIRAILGTDSEGTPVLSLADAAGQERVVLGSMETITHAGVTQKHPVSTITLVGETGQVLWQAP